MVMFAAKAVLGLAAAMVLYRSTKKNGMGRGAVIFACLTALIAMAVGQKAASFVPELTDQVTITALSEKNQDAKSSEIVINGYTVDGEDHPVGEITSGKWFWFGDKYMWRPETDKRQPEGTTDTIRLEIPVGKERGINFSAGIYRGMARVEVAGEWELVDLYSDPASTKTVEIGSSTNKALILNGARSLSVYAAVMLLICAAAGYFASIWLKKPTTKEWLIAHKAVGVIALIALAQLLFAFHYVGIDGLWQDELCEITWSVGSKSLLERAFRGVFPLPLFASFAGLWYEIAPYGEQYLLFPSEIATAIGVFLVGLAGREMRGNAVGIMSALAAAISSTLLVQCSYETRSYAFLFAGAALVLYLILRRVKMPDRGSWKTGLRSAVW